MVHRQPHAGDLDQRGEAGRGLAADLAPRDLHATAHGPHVHAVRVGSQRRVRGLDLPAGQDDLAFVATAQQILMPRAQGQPATRLRALQHPQLDRRGLHRIHLVTHVLAFC